MSDATGVWLTEYDNGPWDCRKSGLLSTTAVNYGEMGVAPGMSPEHSTGNRSRRGSSAREHHFLRHDGRDVASDISMRLVIWPD